MDTSVNEMQFDFEGLIRLVAQNLYSEKKVFIRELIQNAHDGVRRRVGSSGTGRIDIETRPQDLEITVRDNGVGMNHDDLVEYLSNIGKSLTRLERDETEGLIGQFGIGFLSAFVVAASVQVRTRKDGESAGWLWENDGSKQYRISECEVPAVGTSVTVRLRDVSDRGLIQETEVRELIRKYADMLQIPIYLNGSADPENTMHMPWEKTGLSPQELWIGNYAYLSRTMSDSVLEAIPVRVRGDVHIDGVLYISRTRLVSVDQPRVARVYQNRMFLCDNAAADILPRWARFVNGIINTPDLTPTAARDNFLRDDAAARVSEALGDVIIAHLEQLREDDNARFVDIARFHRLGFTAACFYYDEFFRRFADLLLWRTNKGAWSRPAPLPRLDAAQSSVGADEILELPGIDTPGELRSLPEIIAQVPARTGEPTRLPCFTTPSTASQYFEIADAAGSVVVDASGPFESELLEAYTRLPDRDLTLVHVDREDDPAVFRRLGETDAAVQRLAEMMSLTVRTAFGGQIRTEARRFQPATITAVIRSDHRSYAQRRAQELRLDPNQPDDVRQMADELARRTAAEALRLTINAENALVQRIARQNLTDPAVQELMLALYNDAVLANRELITSTDASIFHSQFQRLIGRSLDYLESQSQLDAIKTQIEDEDRRRRALRGRPMKHRIFFMITPFADEFRPTIDACRRVVEDEWGCQLVVGNDRYDDHRVLENVETVMRQADAFIAEVTDANPNVMFELGAAFSDRHNRPFVLLRKTGTEPPLPADLRSLIYIDYDPVDGSVDQRLATEMRKHAMVQALLDAPDRAQYLSPRRLSVLLGPSLTLPPATIARLAARFPTREDWDSADVDTVADVLGDVDSDVAELILKRIRTRR
ncbi:ATP-binding protein [Cryptosporangium phraense]|nr:ATP-binding protein [Cryptosporangium phraense]